jgi:16S rRNA (cytosine967-C5)-methyltransferase
MTILDYCAGAGGKSLALASALGNHAEILAYDISKERLEQLAIRAKRAGADCIRIMYRPEDLSGYAQSADIVLVDAPCSGTGTLRRHPDLAWRISPEKIDRYNEIQHQILVDATRFVAPEGFLFYVTCSLLTQENEGIIHSFLASHPDFRIVGMPEMWIMDITRMPDRRLEPHRHQSDGFFGILLKRSSTR